MFQGKTTQSGLGINVCVTLIAVVVVQIFSENIIMLFDPASTGVIKDGVLYLRICCSVNSLVYAVMYTFDSFAVGAGSANVAMCNALLDAVVVPNQSPLGAAILFGAISCKKNLHRDDTMFTQAMNSAKK